MDIIRTIQTTELLNDAILANQLSATSLDLPRLRAIIDNMSVSKALGKELFQARKLTKMESVDYMNVHNVNIRSLLMDYRTIIGSFHWLNTEMDKLSKMSDMMGSFFSVAFARMDKQLMELRRKLELGSKTIVIDFKDRKQIDGTSDADIDYLTGSVKLSAIATTDRVFRFKDYEIVNPVIDFTPDYSVDIGRMNSLFDPTFTGEVKFRIMGRNNSGTEGTISVNLEQDDDPPTLNSITVRSRNIVPTEIQPIIIVDGVEIPLNKDIVTNGNATFTFSPVRVSGIRFRLKQMVYSELIRGLYAYDFSFNHILLENTVLKNSSTVVSTGLTTEEGITSVKLRSIEKLPINTAIRYSISTDGISWSTISASNKGPDNADIVSIGSRKDIELSRIDTEIPDVGSPYQGVPTYNWSDLTPINEYGDSSLYNILEKTNDGNITDGRINLASGEYVDVDSIKVYRGLDNYEISTKVIEIPAFTENTLYLFNVTDGYFTAESIYVAVEREAQIVKYDQSIITRYRPNKSLFIKVTDDQGEDVTIISHNNNRILLRDITRGKTVYVSYTTTITEIETVDNVDITIDDTSFEVRMAPGARNLGGASIIYDPSNKLITIASVNDYFPNATGTGTYQLFISFRYTVSSKQEIKIFTTNVLYETQEEITVYPFTQAEIKAGNIHMIDGTIVSSMQRFTMTRGWHEILTTQPYMSDPSNPKDINNLTGRRSTAGLDLGNYRQMLAFKKSLKQVSIKNLANRVRKGDHRSFAFDGSRILINFVPEELPMYFESVSSHLTGTELLGKKAHYENDQFQAFTRIDDSFLVNYTIKDEENSTSTIFVKAELSKAVAAVDSPELRRIELILS